MAPFFQQSSALTIGDIATLTGAMACAPDRLGDAIRNIASLGQARPSDLTFAEDPADIERLAATRAGACLVSEALAVHVPAHTVALRTAEPFRAFVAAARKLYPDSLGPRSLFDSEPIGTGALLHPTAEIEDGAIIDPGAAIGPRACIGAGTVIGANAVIGPDVQIGRDGSIGPGVSIVHALIGDHVIVHAGCRIGEGGFHAARRPPLEVPQVGRVIIQDRVEVGANAVIDRGGCGDTVVGEGSKIDNLVQIGHNVMIGRYCVIVAQCGLSGGATLGDHVTLGRHVVLGGGVGVADHITIGDGAMVGAAGAVKSDIPAGARRL